MDNHQEIYGCYSKELAHSFISLLNKLRHNKT